MNCTFTKYIRICWLLPAILLLLSSCKQQELIQYGDPLDVAYEKALNLFNEGEYDAATNAFERVVQMGRGTDFGRDAQYYLAESYLEDADYLLAASEYERYQSIYPRSERRREIEFKQAYCYYKASPRYKLDQSYTHRAIELFRLFRSRYPDSDRVQEANKYIEEMREKLARKLYEAADLYYRLGYYEASTIYYDLTIDQYPATTWAEQALVNEINVYVEYASRSVESKQRERYQSAIDTYEKFLQLYPNSGYRERAEEYVGEARQALANLDNTSSNSQDSRTDSTENGG